MKKSSRIICAVVSSILLILSFPDFNLGYFAWIAFLPLFFALDGCPLRKSFLTGYLTGVIFFIGTIYWLVHVTLPGMLVVVLYLALYFAFFSLSYSFLTRNTKPIEQLFLVPAAWVVCEFLRSVIFGGFGWALLGHSQSRLLPIIQIADITGAYGVSFLVIMVNMAVFLTVKDIRKKDYTFAYLIITSFLIFICLAYGIYRARNVFTGEVLRVGVVQGNIPQKQKWDADFREKIMDKYEALTRQAAADKPDVIIWPETSVPGFIDSERDLRDKIVSLAKDTGTHILVGAPTEGISDDDEETYYNSAVLFAPDETVVDRYSKLHLVPFGEYVPFKKVFSFVERFASSPIGDFAKGEKPTVFKFFIERSYKDKDVTWKMIKKAKFSVMICFEDVFPEIARDFVKKGAAFLVNITNDAWFHKTSALYQHAQASVFRAVENRVNVVRAANTGYSCFIDQKGDIVSEVRSGDETLFIDGYKVHDIVLTNTRTIYTVYGDVFVYLCSFVFAFTIIRIRWKNT